jgi:hypothetical protein
MRDCGIPNEWLWSSNIWKCSKTYCSIVNNISRRFIIYCYTIVLSDGEACERGYLVYQNFFNISVIDVICNLINDNFLNFVCFFLLKPISNNSIGPQKT